MCNDTPCATVAIETRRVTQSDERPSPHDSAPKLALCVSMALDAGCHFHTDWMASRDVASKSIIPDGRGLVLSIPSLSGETCLRVVTSQAVPFPSHRCRKSHVTSLWGHLVAPRQERPHPRHTGQGLGLEADGMQAAKTLSLSEPSCWLMQVKPWGPFSLVLFAWDLPIKTTPEDCTCVFV